MFNHTEFCNAAFVESAKFVTIPFSASTLSPRNGKAALDLAAASLHVNDGEAVQNYQSGVRYLDPEILKEQTMSLRCPLNLDDVVYAAPPPPPSRSHVTMNALPSIIVLASTAALALAA